MRMYLSIVIVQSLSTVVFQPPSYQYKQCLPLVLVVCNVQIKTLPATQSSVELIGQVIADL